MKSYLVFILLFISTSFGYAQTTKVYGRSTRSADLEGKVFNKLSGELITNLQLSELLKEKPGLQLEIFYDEYGLIEKCLFDPSDPFKKYSRDPEKSPKIGEIFPEFVFKTINEEVYESKEMKGKWVLIHFVPLAQFIQKESWEKLVNELQKARENIDIECFGVFAYNDDLTEAVGEFQPDIKLVNNGSGFYSRYHIIKTPTTVLIDPNGNVAKYFYEKDVIDLNQYH